MCLSKLLETETTSSLRHRYADDAAHYEWMMAKVTFEAWRNQVCEEEEEEEKKESICKSMNLLDTP